MLCKTCNEYKDESNFKKGKRVLKNCDSCRIKLEERRRCIHGTRKTRCRECGGSGICEHDRQRTTCKICGDEKEITIRNMIQNSKQKDKKYNRFDADNFIDCCFIEQLMFESMSCYRCNVDMQLLEFRDNLVTIERLDNSIGHIKSNCVLACRKCNVCKVGNKL